MAASKFQNPPQAPLVFTTTGDAVKQGMDKANDESKAIVDKLVAEVKPENATFSSVIEPALKSDNELNKGRVTSVFYQYVSSDAAVRDGSTKADEAWDSYNIDAKMRDDIFKLVDAAYNTRASQNLDTEKLRILEKERQAYVRNGLLLPAGPQRDHFKDVQKRLSQLCIESAKNHNEEAGGIWFTPAELDGVPKDDVDIDGLERGSGENEGKVRVSFKYNHLIPILKYAVNEETRKVYQIAESNKVNKNVPLFEEIIALRDEAARMLGYPNHASLKIEDKMAKTADTVNTFLNGLRKNLAAGGAQEMEKLREYKKKDTEARGAPFDGNLYMWDVAFYTRLIKEKEYSVDEGEISQYFALWPTFDGMLKIFEEVLGLQFSKLEKEDLVRLSPTGKAGDCVWHEDVLIYSVWNEESAGGDFLGYLYLDMHPRDNKFTHNANFDLHSGYVKEDGSRYYTCTALVCNFSKPSATKPALLKHNEVVTLFHELGHGVHSLVSQTRYTYFHGTSVARDFVEAPSQMLENWCWTPSVLKALSQRWDTKAKIPDDVVDSLVKTKNFNSATSTLTQLLYGIFDMTVHSPASHEEVTSTNFGVLYNKLRHDITGVKGPEDLGQGLKWGNRHATIGHFVGGYDAGYYGYLYSKVFSADMFYSFFEKNPMDGAQGRRYREKVLFPGGSKEELDLLRDFLGREPNADAFYKELGIPQ